MSKWRQRAKDIFFGPKEPGITDERKRSFNFFILEACTGTISYTMTTGVFMTGLALYLGASDYLAGILASVQMLMNSVQIPAAFVVERVKHKKRYLSITYFMFRVMLSSCILIPLILPKSLWVPAFVTLNVLGFLSNSLGQPGFNDWMFDLVPLSIRGVFAARREARCQLLSVIFSLTMGVVVDALGQGYGAFAVPYSIAICVGLINFWCIRQIETPPKEAEDFRPPRVSFRKRLMGNKPVLQFSAIWILWNFGYMMAFSYFSVFMISSLGLSYSFMTVQNTVQMLSLVIAIRFWGRYADRAGWPRCLRMACLVIIAAFVARAFVVPSVSFLLIPIAILTGIGMGGTNIGPLNMVSYLGRSEERSFLIGLQAGVSGLSGFLGSLVDGGLNEAFRGVQVGPFTGLHITFLAAGVVMAAAWIVFSFWARSKGVRALGAPGRVMEG